MFQLAFPNYWYSTLSRHSPDAIPCLGSDSLETTPSKGTPLTSGHLIGYPLTSGLVRGVSEGTKLLSKMELVYSESIFEQFSW